MPLATVPAPELLRRIGLAKGEPYERRELTARIERYVEMARQTPGARILTGGARPNAEGLRRGYFYTPTLIEGVPAQLNPVAGSDNGAYA